MVTTHLALYSFFSGMGGTPSVPPSFDGFTTAGPLWAWNGYTAGAVEVPVEVPRFGGGPFWRQYGYDKAWDTESASTETFEALQPSGFDEVARVPFTDYREVESREKVAAEAKRKAQEEEDLMIALLYLDESDPQD